MPCHIAIHHRLNTNLTQFFDRVGAKFMLNVPLCFINCYTRVCLKIAFGKLCATLRRRFEPDEEDVAGYVDRIGTKYTVKWGVQLAGMNFQTLSSNNFSHFKHYLCLAHHFQPPISPYAYS